MNMKKILSIIISITVGASINAQQLEKFISENIDRAAGNLHTYEIIDYSDAKAPKGYKPFYISHYSRHGSRYHSSESFYTKTIAKLTECERQNLLTDDGKYLLNTLRKLKSEHEGMFGYLTQVGSRQQQEIAQRMFDNYPSVFKNKDNKIIYAVSSKSERCIQSMANFCTTMKGCNPSLQVQYYTGKRYMKYISHSFDISYQHKLKHHICDSILHADFNGDRLMAKTFTDVKKAHKIIGSRYIFKSIFDELAISQNLDAEIPDLLKTYFTIPELAAFARSDNARYYATWCITEEFGDKYVQGVGGPLLKKMIEEADEAIKGNGHAADVRFGHDSALMPLYPLLGIEDFPVRHEAEAGEIWHMGKYMCMASNLQLIFFKNKEGDILVKLRRNESDVNIPALKAVSGPFYSWNEFRNYALDRISL